MNSGDDNAYQKATKQTEQQFSSGPLGFVDSGQEVVDKVLK